MSAIGIGVATIVAFIISSTYYALVPLTPATRPDAAPATRPDAATTRPEVAPGAQAGSGRPAPWQIMVELLRSAVTATLVAGLLDATGHRGPAAGALLGLALWALPLVLLTGSVVWEHVPVRDAARHAGDWLIKLLAIGAIVGALA